MNDKNVDQKFGRIFELIVLFPLHDYSKFKMPNRALKDKLANRGELSLYALYI